MPLTHYASLFSRVGLGVAASAVSIAVLTSARLRSLPAPKFLRIFSALFVASRLALFTIIFFLLRLEPRGDIPAFYWTQALAVRNGALPYRDFQSSYAPLHPYIDAAVLAIWHSPLAIILFAIVCECVLVSLWLRKGNNFFLEAHVRTAALFYLCSAVSLQFVTVDGQDNVAVALLLTLGIFLLHRSRVLLSGFCVGVAIAAFKFLPLVYTPLYLIASRRLRWAIGFAVGCVPIYALCMLKHLPFLQPLLFEGSRTGSGNLPYLIETIIGVDVPPRVWDIILLAVLGGILAIIFRYTRHASPEGRLRIIVFGIAAITLAIILFSKKSWPPYLLLALFPICLSLSKRKAAVFGFAIFNVVAVTEPSVWAVTLEQSNALKLHHLLALHNAHAFVLLALELALCGGYAVLLRCALRRVSAESHH